MDKEKLLSDPKLYEFMGALMGDGHVRYYPKRRHYGIAIYGHIEEDREYLLHLQKLIKKLLDVNPVIKERPKYGTVYLRFNSKPFLEFLMEIGVPNGIEKKNLTVPIDVISSNKEHMKMFLRGLIDTDGCLIFGKKGTYKEYVYPVIELKVSNRNLIYDAKLLFEKLGFRSHIRTTKKAEYVLYISGVEQLEKWIKEIGFNNPKHYTKYLIWKSFGKCQPGSTLKERKQRLSMKSGSSKVVMRPT